MDRSSSFTNMFSFYKKLIEDFFPIMTFLMVALLRKNGKIEKSKQSKNLPPTITISVFDISFQSFFVHTYNVSTYITFFKQFGFMSYVHVTCFPHFAESENFLCFYIVSSTVTNVTTPF